MINPRLTFINRRCAFAIFSFSMGFFLLLGIISQAFAQINALTNNLDIVEVVYEVDGLFYTQSTNGSVPGGLTANDNNHVHIYRITYTPDGGTTEIDVYPLADDVDVFDFASEITGNTAPSDDIAVIEPVPFGVTNYDAPGGTFVPEGDYEEALERITSFPDVRTYWTVNGTALGASGTGYQDFMSFLFYIRDTFGTPDQQQTFTEPDAVFLATERDGNSPMLFTPLDQSGSPITDANQVEIDASSTGDYPWNTGFSNSDDPNSSQVKYLLLFSNELFFNTNPGSAENIYGFDIDLEHSYADGSVIAFRDPQTRITVGECWRTLSSTPITGATFSELLDNIWTQGLPGSKYPGAGPANSNILLWDRTYNGDDETIGWTTTDPRTDTTLDLNDTIETGTGFLLSVFADDDFDGTDDDFPKVLTVQGKENNSTVTPTMNNQSNGWTLLGNPYGAPILWSDVIANNTSNTTEVAYVYDRNAGGSTNGNNGGWRTTNSTLAGDIENGLIAPFQGFFVQNDNSTSAQIELQLDDRRSIEFTPGGSNEWIFYGKDKSTQYEHVRLEVEGEGLLNSAWVSFTNDGDYNRVKGDAYELIPFSENYALLSTRKGDELFDIGQFSDDNNVRIPVNLETTKPGTYTIRVTRFDLAPGSNLMFTDLKENISIPFDEHFEYEFTVQQAAKANIDPLSCGATAQELAAKFKIEKAKSKNSDRFIIQHASAVNGEPGETPSEIKLNQNYPNPFNPTTQISYQLPQQSEVLLEVYDLTGKLITTLVNETVSAGIHSVTLDAQNLSSGVYIYRLQTGARTLSRKLTVIK